MRVIVIGAGVFGASTAYHLARDGAEVVLIDRADEGRATAAGAGIVCPWATKLEDPAIYALLEGGARYYTKLVAELAALGETDLGFARVGALYVPDDEAELEGVARRLQSRSVAAAEIGLVERVTPAQARVLFPPLRPDLAGLFVSGGARVNGRKLAAALRRAAVRCGASERTGSAALELAAGRATGVRLDGELIAADRVVVAAGAWAQDLLAPTGTSHAVQPQRGQIVHLRLPGTDTSRWPTIQPVNAYYLLAFDDSRVVVGASREFGSGFDYRLTAAGVAGVLNAGLHTAPGLAEWTIEEIRIGFRPLADDNRPILGAVPEIANLFVGNGLGASGLTMGPWSGKLLAEVTLGQTPELDLTPYRPAARNSVR